MIFIKMQGGMGNQMFMYAFARMLSEETGQEICLDYSEFADFSRNHNATFENTLGNFNIVNCKVITDKNEFVDLAGSTAKKYFSLKRKLDIVLKLFMIPGRHMIEQWNQPYWNGNGLFFGRDGYVDVHPELVNSDNIVANGYWQSDKYFFKIKDAIRKELRVTTTLDKKNMEMIEYIKNSEAVAVHIRRGDYVKNGQTHCSDNYYRKAIEVIREKKENAKFFVFSDDIVYTRSNMIFPDGTIFVDLKNAGYDDLRLMYSCKNIIMSNSSMSWWAQFLMNNEKKIVVAPKPWFRKILNDIYSNDWENISVYERR